MARDVCVNCGEQISAWNYGGVVSERVFCRSEECQKALQQLQGETREDVRARGECIFLFPYLAYCRRPSISDGFCAEHMGNKCETCGRQATRGCAETGAVPCRIILCDECEHYNHYV